MFKSCNLTVFGVSAGIFIGTYILNLLSKKKKKNSRKGIGIEIGGTNIKIAVSDFTNFKELRNNIDEEISTKLFQNQDQPEETVQTICNWIKTNFKDLDFNNISVGLSMFGPLNLTIGSPGYGTIVNTPKIAWKNFNIYQSFRKNLNIRTDQISIGLDVNCAALLEYKYGSHNVSSLAYITVGTGVGVGLVIQNKVNKGLENPEGGHIRVKRHPKDNYKGFCPLHEDCLEGLVANNALKERKGLASVSDLINLDDSDEIWDFAAYYLAQLCLSLLYLPSVEKILIGGGIVNRSTLLPKIRDYFFELNNDYVSHPQLSRKNLDNYIKRTEFNNNSGILSAFSIIN